MIAESEALEVRVERLKQADKTVGEFMKWDIQTLGVNSDALPDGHQYKPEVVKTAQHGAGDYEFEELEFRYADGATLTFSRECTARPMTDRFDLAELPAGTPIELSLSFEATKREEDIQINVKLRPPHSTAPVALVSGGLNAIDPDNPTLPQVEAMEGLANRVDALLV